MIYRVFPEKDTWLTDTVKGLTTPTVGVTRMTGSNFGASEILELYKNTGASGASGFAGSSSLARTIVQFDLSEISALTASGEAPSTGSLYFFKLFDAQHANKLPSSFDVEIVAMSRSWDEGKGIDNDNFLDKGVANWDKSQTNVLWTTTGGDFLLSASVTASYHFDTGHEDIEVDVTDMVGAWLTGGLPNNGFMVKITGSQELDETDYFRKKFHARNTNFRDKRPTLEMRFDDSLKDDRGVFLFGISSSLYLYNKERGQLKDITSVGTGQDVIDVALSDVSGNVILNASGSHTGFTGIYSASMVLPTSSIYSGSAFTDGWSLTGNSFLTGAFTPHNDGAQSSNVQEQYVVSMKNMRKEYDLNELVRFNLFVRTRTYNPAVVQTGSLALDGTIIEKGYYRVDNASTEEQVIPLGTGSLETTRLSYDENGNYFNFYVRTLAQRELYRLVFFFEIDGQLQRIEQDFRFRVV